MIDLAAIATDPAVFREHVLIDTDAGPRPLAEVCEPWQAADFEALDASWQRVAGLPVGEAPRRAWFERPRGHSKTSDTAIAVTWALAFSQRKLSGVVAAADSDQAGLLRKAIDSLLRLNPWLASMLTVQQSRVLNPHSGSVLEILTSDAQTSYGLLPDFIVADELTHWKTRDLWDSLLSAAAKRGHCLLTVITNAGFAQSWQWKTREKIRNTHEWIFSRLEGPQASWIDSAALAEQRALLPDIQYRRLWLNEWSTGEGDAITEADLQAALTLGELPERAEKGYVYIGGLDLGLKRDHTGLVVIGRHVGFSERIESEHARPRTVFDKAADLDLMEPTTSADNSDSEAQYVSEPPTFRTRVVYANHWKPDGATIQLEPIEQAILDLHSRFSLAVVGYDPFQSEYLAERLRKQGVCMLPVMFVPAALKSMAQAVMSCFKDRTIELPNNEQLLAELRTLRVEDRGTWHRLVSPKNTGNGHGDIATALSIALHAARDFRMSAGPPTIQRNLIVSPS